MASLMKKGWIFVVLLVLAFTGCPDPNSPTPAELMPETIPETIPQSGEPLVVPIPPLPDESSIRSAIKAIDISDDAADLMPKGTADAGAVTITLDQGNSTTSDASKVAINNSTNTITVEKDGTYVLSGTLSNGKVLFKKKTEQYIILNGVNITTSEGSPFAITGGDKKILTLAAGSNNFLTDGSTYPATGDDGKKYDPNGALFADLSLTINGTGSLTVTGKSNNGISVKDHLKIMSGTITVGSPDNPLKGNDSIVIKGGSITLTATGGDGMKTNTDKQTGFIYISNANLNITASKSGMEAYEAIRIESGNINIKGGGGFSSGAGYHPMSVLNELNAIECDGNILVEGGTVTIDSASGGISGIKSKYDDDAGVSHVPSTVIISGGSFNIKSNSTAIHSDGLLVIDGGTINVTNSYEGIEGAKVVIKDGTISVDAYDDGINADGDSTASSHVTQGCDIIVTGGNITVKGGLPVGAGFDANGIILISGGVINSYGGGEDAFHNGGGVVIQGGAVYGTGPVIPVDIGANSGQISLGLAWNASQAAPVNVVIKDDQGTTVVNKTFDHSFRTCLISVPGFVKDGAYSLAVNSILLNPSFTLPNVVNKIEL